MGKGSLRNSHAEAFWHICCLLVRLVLAYRSHRNVLTGSGPPIPGIFWKLLDENNSHTQLQSSSPPFACMISIPGLIVWHRLYKYQEQLLQSQGSGWLLVTLQNTAHNSSSRLLLSHKLGHLQIKSLHTLCRPLLSFPPFLSPLVLTTSNLMRAPRRAEARRLPTLAHRNRSDFRDLRLRCPPRTPEIARFPRQEKAMLHCDLRVRWKVASDSRFRAAFSEPKTPSFCRISGDLFPSTQKSLAIAIVRFWCAKLPTHPRCHRADCAPSPKSPSGTHHDPKT